MINFFHRYKELHAAFFDVGLFRQKTKGGKLLCAVRCLTETFFFSDSFSELKKYQHSRWKAGHLNSLSPDNVYPRKPFTFF